MLVAQSAFAHREPRRRVRSDERRRGFGGEAGERLHDGKGDALLRVVTGGAEGAESLGDGSTREEIDAAVIAQPIKLLQRVDRGPVSAVKIGHMTRDDLRRVGVVNSNPLLETAVGGEGAVE